MSTAANSRKDTVKSYIDRMRALTASVSRRNEKIHGATNGNGQPTDSPTRGAKQHQ